MDSISRYQASQMHAQGRFSKHVDLEKQIERHFGKVMGKLEKIEKRLTVIEENQQKAVDAIHLFIY